MTLNVSNSEPIIPVIPAIPANILARPPSSGPARHIVVLCGINYLGQSGELSGCVNDVATMYGFLKETFGIYKAMFLVEREHDLDSNCRNALVDCQQPTAAGIRQAMQWVVKQANAAALAGDKPIVIWHYSGHGSSIRDTSGDERDGRDETLVPVDYATGGGMITDDEIFASMCSKLPSTTDMLMVNDCCHSGSSGDLAFRWDPTVDKAFYENTHGCDAKIISITGCRDDQTSADAKINGKFQGAMTAALVDSAKKLMARGQRCTVGAMGDAMHAYMARSGYAQRPQICSSQSCWSGTDAFPFSRD